ncbi:MAG: L,D-transpeptidase family protein [Hyphomicrobiaceae bacterium]|nr:L,D-transpeptidase family protein [Hyphomicrobiaceae bacterium]
MMGLAPSPGIVDTVCIGTSVAAHTQVRPGRGARALVAAALLVCCMPASSALAQGQLDWANKIFGLPTSVAPGEGRARRQERPEAPLEDLRTGDVPLRSEAMLEALDLAYGRYKAIAQKGGWPQIPTARMIRPGDDDERVPIVRRRLLATGELRSASNTSFNLDGELEAGVRRFQKAHGLSVTGRVDRSTIAAMNVPVQARMAQIKLNYDRIAELLDRNNRDERYILVNVPGFQLEAVERGKVAQRHRVIAGREQRQTPVVKASIRALNFFPHWRVPDSVAKLDVAPRLVKEPEYLQKEQIRVLSGNYNGPEIDATRVNWAQFDHNLLKLRQDPGPQNALGLVRLDMPNEHGVYMHDTPMKPLFGRAQRAFSAGCVRVQDVFDLAAWIANGDQGVDRRRIDEILTGNSAVDITLTHPVPVYFVYLTAWAEPGGHAEFRPDIYARDGLKELSSDREHDPDAPPPPPPTLAP